MRRLFDSKPRHCELRIWKQMIVVQKCDGQVAGADFKFPFAPEGSEKLYIVTVKGELVYVGVTRRRIRDRINYGLRHNPEKSRYGYKWRDEKGVLGLYVWTAGPSRDDEDKKKRRDFAEAVEAEVAGLHRHLTGKWPEYQNEVHFHNKPGAAKLAAKLYAEIMK